MPDANKLIQKIAPYSNKYNSKESSTLDKLIAMWDIGNILVSANENKPHSLGWEIQEKTGGIIKRPLVFRSYKVRKIWESKKKLISECRETKNLSNITEMLPLIDSDQKSDRKNIPESVINDLREKMVVMESKEFQSLLKKIKTKYKDERMGQENDRSRNDPEMYPQAFHFNTISKLFTSLIDENKKDGREKLRSAIPSSELEIFSKICNLIASSEDNSKNVSIVNKESSKSINEDFKSFFDFSIQNLINNKQKRNLFRKVAKYKIPFSIPEISDIAASLVDEDAIKKYHSRKKLEIKL